MFDQLIGKSIEAFLPTVARWSRWRDRRKRIDWPLFPSYCFVRWPHTSLLPVLSCPGVLQVVSFGAKPAPVPDYEIDAIRRLLATTLRYDPCPFVAEGTMVRVERGPLAGACGRLLQKGRDFRLLLAVEMLGRALSVHVDACDVEPLTA